MVVIHVSEWKGHVLGSNLFVIPTARTVCVQIVPAHWMETLSGALLTYELGCTVSALELPTGRVCLDIDGRDVVMLKTDPA